FRVISAEIGEVHAGLAQPGDQRGEVLVAGGYAVEDRHLDAGLLQHVAHGSGDAFTVLLLVMDDRDLLRLDLLDDVLAGGRALQAVQTYGAEYQLVAAGGDVRAGGRRWVHEDARGAVGVGRRVGRSVAQLASTEAADLVDGAVGVRHPLLGVTGVLEYRILELPAVPAAGPVAHVYGHVVARALHV